jgi:hypothetical protein
MAKVIALDVDIGCCRNVFFFSSPPVAVGGQALATFYAAEESLKHLGIEV